MKVDFSKVIELSHDMIPSAPTADVKQFDHSPEAAPFDPDHTKEEHFRLMAQWRATSRRKLVYFRRSIFLDTLRNSC